MERRTGKLEVTVFDQNLKAGFACVPITWSLSARHPSGGRRAKTLAQVLKLPFDADGFFLEAHIKLRPLDFANAGMFLCGLGHGPKALEESIAQAKGAAARAATVLAQKQIMVGGPVAVVDEELCVACLTCVRTCPFGVPRWINEGMSLRSTRPPVRAAGTAPAPVPRKLIQVQHQRDDQIMAKETALFEWGGTARSWGSVFPEA